MLEQAVHYISGSLQHLQEDVLDCAELLDAAGKVVDYQLLFGLSMGVTAVCADGSALNVLARGLRELADAIATVSS